MNKQKSIQWERLLSKKRLGNPQTANTSSTSQYRTDFHIDYDRVVFSSAFRRLGRKTQVHPLAQHDHTHNRLTHSVEVASVGRSLGNLVGEKLQQQQLLPSGYTPHDISTIVQVACLAHDVGNPPFGHTGEDALRAWFRHPHNALWLQPLTEAQRHDIQTYEGNAHSVRILTSLEMYAEKGGMQLTAASIGALVKYPWTTHHPIAREKGKFNIYQTELSYFQAVADELGLIAYNNEPWCWQRHPLSYLMEAADDICYAILDLEDAVEMDILSFAEFTAALFAFFPEGNPSLEGNTRQKCASLRGKAIGKCTQTVADCFMTHQDALLAGTFQNKDLINACPTIKTALDKAKELAEQKIYHHRSKLVTEIAAYPCIASILDLLIPAVHNKLVTHPSPKSNSKQEELALALMEPCYTIDSKKDTLYDGYMKILDFVGSMTDNYAAKIGKEISGIGIV